MTNPWHEWTLDDLRRWEERIHSAAAGFGLNPYPVEFRVCTWEQMIDILAYGMPSHYHHWSYGKAFEHLRTYRKHQVPGGGMALEVVLPTDPALAYLWRDNSLPVQIMVMAHVYAHSDFTRNNRWFQLLRKPASDLDSGHAHAEEIRAYTEDPSVPTARVEELISAAHALRFHRPRDPAYRRLPRESQVRAVVAKHRELARPAEWDHLKPAAQRSRPEPGLDRVPLEPDGDLLRFLAEYAPLQSWERRLLEIVAQERDRSLANIETKIMNEGWATFWHDRICRSLPDLPRGFEIEYALSMSHLLLPSYYGSNPYHLGFRIWEDIRRRWEYPTDQNRRELGLPGGEGDMKLFQIRTNELDLSFVGNYLTDELIAHLGLYRYQREPEPSDPAWHRVLDLPDREGYERIRRALVERVGAGDFPALTVLDANLYGDRRLILNHQHDGRDLYLFDPPLTRRGLRQADPASVRLHESTVEVLRHILTIWKNPIELRTIYDRTPIVIECDREGKVQATDFELFLEV